MNKVMSLLPLLFSTWWAELDQPHRLTDQNFGLGLTPEQLMLLDNYYLRQNRWLIGRYTRPWTDMLHKDGGGMSIISSDKNTFQVMLDVQQFKPEEITVKVVDRYIVVEVKHEEKKDRHELILRQFVRRYKVPEKIDIDKVASNISSDGMLIITAPVKELPESEKNEIIKIKQTGKLALRSKENKEETTTKSSMNSTTQQTQEQTQRNPPK